jgi:hypothetical protein
MSDSPNELFPSDEPNEIQARKRNRHVWVRGVLGWGGFMFLWMTLFEWYSKGYIQIPPLRVFLQMMIPNLIIWPIAGYWWGAKTWRHKRDTD